MKKLTTIVGVILIIVGIVTLAYRGISYTKEEQVAKLGPLEVTQNKEKMIPFPPLLGGLSLAAGIVLVLVGNFKRPK